MRAEINVTPLIDVMLVLLILFMLVTPVATRSLEARIPEPATTTAPKPINPLVLTVEPTLFRLDQSPVLTTSDLHGQLRDVLLARSDRTLFVRAEGDVAYGRVVEAMDVARGAGAERIGIVLASR
jgi:biopolymer transport protein ExbD